MIDPLAVAAAAVTPEVPEPQPALSACLFVLAGSLFAVDVRSAREVAVFDGFTVVPRAPSCLLGVANLRGIVMPIVDIRSLLDLPAHRPGTVIKGLVIEDAPIRAAIAIEAALGLEPFTHVISEGLDRHGFCAGRLPRGDELVALLDAPRILGALAREMRRANQTQEDRG